MNEIVCRHTVAAIDYHKQNIPFAKKDHLCSHRERCCCRASYNCHRRILGMSASAVCFQKQRPPEILSLIPRQSRGLCGHFPYPKGEDCLLFLSNKKHLRSSLLKMCIPVRNPVSAESWLFKPTLST